MKHPHFGRSRGRRADISAWNLAEQGERLTAFPPFGPPGLGPPPGFGPRGMGGPPWGRGGGRRGRARGDIRTAILALLAEQPRHGYDIIREVELRSNGLWKPSAGSIYPTLQALEDQGLIVFSSVEGRKTASLTSEGEEWVTENSGEVAKVFSSNSDSHQVLALRDEVFALMEAARHVGSQLTDEAQTRAAAEIIADARKGLYRLLADQA